LFPDGIHPITLGELKKIGVDAFPLSLNRPKIYRGFCELLNMLEIAGIWGDIIVDGSFITEEIEPLDIDSSLCVSHAYFESCSGPQFRLLGVGAR
jgi:hypothetical protein